jgi:hypothetical protein
MSGKPAVDSKALAVVIPYRWVSNPATRQIIADHIIASGVIRDAAEVRRDALAAVEALTPMISEEWPTTGEWLARPDVLRAISGDSSALDAVKAAERERIAQAIDAGPVGLHGPGVISRAEAAAIARNGGDV